MWFHIQQLNEMLTIYNSLDSVGEILIVNNDETKRPELNFEKVRIIGNGKNIYVNPSWKLGVQESKFDNVILANDDITIKGELDLLLRNISYLLREGIIVGVGENCYRKGVSLLKLKECPINDKTRMGWGFGVFMCMKKITFLNTPIPKDFLVWYGDHILYLTNKAWSFEGVSIDTNMKGTTSKLNLSGFAAREKQAFHRYLKAGK